MSHFNPKISIEVCVRHSNAIPFKGDGFSISRSDRDALNIILIFDSMHF
jgi:hypothetical protein